MTCWRGLVWPAGADVGLDGLDVHPAKATTEAIATRTTDDFRVL